MGPSPRGRRNRCSRRSTQQEQGERVAEGSRGVAGGNDGHPYYIGDTRRDGIRRQSLDLDEKIGGDEPRAAVHPIQNAYDRLSTTPTTEEEDRLEVFYLDFLEGSGKKLPENDEGSPPVDGGGDDDEELWANDEGTKSEQPTTTDDRKSIDDGDDGDEKRWAKRNARSIDEGVRFKSQLREGEISAAVCPAPFWSRVKTSSGPDLPRPLDFGRRTPQNHWPKKIVLPWHKTRYN